MNVLSGQVKKGKPTGTDMSRKNVTSSAYFIWMDGEDIDKQDQDK